MAQVTLRIGGRAYDLACRDGEEDHLRALGGAVAERVERAGRAVGAGNEARQLLMAALMLADELAEVSGGARDEPDIAATLDTLASRLEKLAERVENAGRAS